ncbi:MAG: phosphoserine transaminase [Rhodothalassiaceae bacterium]
MTPETRPARPQFSSGPCAKRPGWAATALDTETLGRSHRSKIGKDRLREAITRTRALLGLPDDYRIGIVPGSDTGAFELAMWNLLGPRPVDLIAFESFGEGWVTDAVKQLRLEDHRLLSAPYGALPDLSQVDPAHDVVFTWNGTTSGVRIPDGDWIAPDREGLTLCDATSAVFAQRLPWDRLDVVTFSWQKALGGEAAHGMLILSPRAVERLQSYKPSWPLPKIFRIRKGDQLNEGIFLGETINTPSMLCVADWIDALGWAERIGGLEALIARADANLATIADWIAGNPGFDFLAERPEIRSNSSVCLRIVDPWFLARDGEGQAKAAKEIASCLEREGVAFDIGGYRDAPPGLRIWCGATVERADIAALLPWLDHALARVKAGHA